MGPATRILTIEMKQEEINGKVSVVLVSMGANTQALEELKCMFATYMTMVKGTKDGSPSMSIPTKDTEYIWHVQHVE